MSSESPRSRQRLWLVALIAFAALVRLIGVDWDNQHFYHPDERAIASAVDRLSFSPLQLNPQFFAYGSFPFYVIRAANSLAAQIDHSYGSYVAVINTGRVVSALVGTLTVLLLYLLGSRLYGWRVGLLAGFLLAACALHVQNSHYGTTDVFLTFVVLLALYHPGRRRPARPDARLRLDAGIAHRLRRGDQVQRPAAARAARRRRSRSPDLRAPRLCRSRASCSPCWPRRSPSRSANRTRCSTSPTYSHDIDRAEPHGAQRRPAALHEPVRRHAEVLLRARSR